MKTSEFKKRILDMGYEVWEHGCVLDVMPKGAKSYSDGYGFVNTKAKSRIDICRGTPNALFDLMVEYARTPIDDREEPKKYYVKPKGIKVHLERVYTYISTQKTWDLLRKDIDYEWQNIFTLEELKELGVPIEHYDLEEVKE